jgi:hypothetical protein
MGLSHRSPRSVAIARHGYAGRSVLNRIAEAEDAVAVVVGSGALRSQADAAREHLIRPPSALRPTRGRRPLGIPSPPAGPQCVNVTPQPGRRPPAHSARAPVRAGRRQITSASSSGGAAGRLGAAGRTPTRLPRSRPGERLRSGYEAFLRGDFETAFSIFAPDIEAYDDARMVGDPVYRGLDGFARMLAATTEASRMSATRWTSSRQSATVCWSRRPARGEARRAASASRSAGTTSGA